MTGSRNRRGFSHTAVPYGSTEELVTAIAPLVASWLAMKDPVFVNIAPGRIEALKAALGPDTDRVRWSDTYRWNPHPARRLRAIQELVEGEERHGRGQLRFLGEFPLSGGPPEMVREWERFDAMLNVALAGSQVTILCIYDVAALPEDVIGHIPSSHPLLGVDPCAQSDAYVEPDAYLHEHRTGFSPVPGTAQYIDGRATPARARALVRGVLAAARGASGPVPRSVVDDLALAVTEIVTNAWQAGAGSVDVACWHADGEAVVQVDDDGPGLGDPLAGYRRPSTGEIGGRGLWISRQLVDLLEVAPHEHGTSVRMRVFDRTTSLVTGKGAR